MTTDNNKIINVNCPTCGTSVIWSVKSPYRPFCSERCKNNDFVDWANENKSIAGQPSYLDEGFDIEH